LPPESNTAPTIGGTPPSAVAAGTPYSFAPTATDPEGDVLTFRIEHRPAWATFSTATGRLQGKPTAADVGSYGDIVITATDGAALAALEPFAITVDAVGSRAAMLSWQAPTENADGSPLTDLAGYKIYWGTKSGVYTASARIDNPGVTAHVVENLVPATYFFVATAFNVEGTEGAPSNETSGRVL
jgi:hypothetical protein